MPRDVELAPPKAGEDVRKLWRTVAELVERNKELQSELRWLRTAFEDLRNQPERRPGAGGGGGLRYRGEWSATLAVSANDIVKVSSGIQHGVYIAVSTPPAGWQPWAGVYYVLLSRPSDQIWA